MQTDNENILLDALAASQSVLGAGINSIKQTEGVLHTFLYTQAVNINRVAGGYIKLRGHGMRDAQKYLVRPALEAALKIAAIEKQKEALFRVVYTEMNDNRDYAVDEPMQHVHDYHFYKQVKSFSQFYNSTFPSHDQQQKAIKLHELARIGDTVVLYRTFYRLYCNYTHSTFTAAAFNISSTLKDDTIVAHCIGVAIGAVVSMGGVLPDLAELRRTRTAALDVLENLGNSIDEGWEPNFIFEE